MDAEQSLREGRLLEALASLQDSVRKDPANSKHRVFLFQVLSVLGDWPRALNQLVVLGQLDASTLMMVQAYREAVRCELLRADVFAGKRTPMVFGEPESWVAMIVQAAGLTGEGKHEEAARLRETAFEQAPTTSGVLDGRRFEWIADADMRLGPILEAVINGRYYWVPFHRLKSLRMEAPTDLRDLVWLPAQFQWANGGEAVGLIPTRYPGTEASGDPRLQMARKTDWRECPGGSFVGVGQRMLATDAGEHSLLDLRDLSLDTGAEGPASTTGGEG